MGQLKLIVLSLFVMTVTAGMQGSDIAIYNMVLFGIFSTCFLFVRVACDVTCDLVTSLQSSRPFVVSPRHRRNITA